jgi:GT2 family glycosyltransferase
MLSVVVPTFDRPGRLLACLAALGRMEPVEGGLEVVVADDGGRAVRSRAEAALGDTAALTLVMVGGTGPAAARNAGAAAAGGALLAFTDDDCEPEPAWGAALARRHRESPAALIGGRIVNALGANRYSRASQAIGDAALAHHNGGPGGPAFFPSSNVAVPAARFAELGGFDAALRRPGGEDRDFCERWAERGWPLVEEPAALVRHSHPLDLRGFWRQQYAYGAGAFHHRRARAARGGGRRLEPSLTSGVAAIAARNAIRDRDPGRLALLGVWQAANLAGFAGAALRRRARPAGR